MATFKIDQGASFALAILMSAKPKPAFKDGKSLEGVQSTTKDGVPQWVVQVSVADRERGDAELLKVTVTSHQNPADVAQVGMPIFFEGLGIGLMNGTPYFVATGIQNAMATSGNGRKSGGE